MHKKKEMGIINLNNDSISALNKNQIDRLILHLKNIKILLNFLTILYFNFFKKSIKKARTNVRAFSVLSLTNYTIG